MLNHLSIQNYALIEKLELDFSDGLSIITGETGAGKSILIGALSLILGERADSKVLQNPGRKCIVEACFDISKDGLNDLFVKHDLDFDNITIIRREINAAGKSRAFINDTPIKLAQLKDFASKLLDIHSQHEKLLLYNPGFHLEIIDAFARHEELTNIYKLDYNRFKETEAELIALEKREKSAKADFDYLSFQLNELSELALDPDGEYEKLGEESNSLIHAEEIKRGLQEGICRLNSEGGVGEHLSEALSSLDSLSSYIKGISDLSNRLKSVYIEVNDIVSEMESLQDQTSYDPERLLLVNDRLDKINTLLHKHSLSNTEELIDLEKSLAQKLNDSTSIRSEVNEKRKLLEILRGGLQEKSRMLSKGRMNAFPEIEAIINKLLEKMAMEDAEISVRYNKLEELGPTGNDDIEILLKANKGSGFAELGKAASGGELSRVMLAIKSSICDLAKLPTMIFDEIDSGISGDVADKMGNLMLAMARTSQIITITHLPQIASKAKIHYLAYKESDLDKTRTFIKQLSDDERLDEIAKMLSGEELSNAALENAKALLKIGD